MLFKINGLYLGMRKIIAILILISGIAKGQNCKGVEDETDKFTGDRNISTTHLAPVSLIKIIHQKTQDTTFYVSMNLDNNNANYNATGAYLLFQNGDKIVKEDQQVKCKYYSGMNKYNYLAVFKIDEDDAKKFTTSPITDFKLFIYDDNIGKGNGSRIMEYAKCVMSR